MQLAFNGNSKSAGKRAGVDGNEIADTIEAVFAYFQATKQDHPRLLDAIEKEAKEWRGNVSSLRGADQDTIDSFFGQPAPKDVTAALAAKGVTRENTAERDYFQKYMEVNGEMQKNGSAYWPGQVVPTLSDYEEILRFDAYREEVSGTKDGPAAQLLKRLDAFDGGRGSKHAALTGLMHATTDYISSTPRHPAEKYTPPGGVKVDYLNAFHHTYSTHHDWHPSDDMQRVTATLNWGAGVGPTEKYKFLAHEKAKIDAAFARGGIQGRAEVKLGKTYGEDAIEIIMTMDDYLNRYLPILRGALTIDTSVPGGTFNGSIQTVTDYTGYEPGKQAFFYGSDVVVAVDALDRLRLDAADPREAQAGDALRFLRETNAVAESPEKLPVAPGQKGYFIRLKRGPAPKGDVFEFDDVYYSSCDLTNKVTDALREVEAVANGRPHKSFLSTHAYSGDTVCFEHKGDMYVPKGEKFYQAALFMQHKYGIDYTWVIRDDEGKKKAGGAEKYVINTSKLDPAVRDVAMAELRQRLEEDYDHAHSLRRATILQKPLQVRKPINFSPKN